MKRASPEMITTGTVGAYLTGSAWAVVLLAVALGTAGQFRESMLWSTGIGGGLVFVLLWVGGAVCEGIGWLGVSRLHGPLAAILGWVTCTLPATYFLLLVLGAATESPGVFYLMVLIQLGIYTMMLVHILKRRDRAVVWPVVTGLALGMIGIIGVVLSPTSEAFGSVAIFFYVAFSGMAIAHLSLSGYFRGAAREARALDVFV